MKPLSHDDLRLILADLTAEGVGLEGDALSPTRHSPVSVPMTKLGQKLSTSCSQDIAVLEDALSFVSSDVQRGNGSIIGPDSKPVSDYWFGCLLAARREYGDMAKDLMRRWSQKSPRYGDGSGFEQAWGQYDPRHPKPVTVGSLFLLAKAQGWRGYSGTPCMPTLPSTDKARFQLLDRAAIIAQPTLRWRVKTLLPETGIGAIYGASGSGKSYLAIDLGISIALGKPWFGNRTSACPVTYVTLEGEAGLRNRISAWEAHNGTIIPAAFKAMMQPFQLAEPEQVEALGAVLPAGGVVIIDTLNRAAPGLDENSSQDMGRILAGMKRLQQITDGLVIVVHHTGKVASKGLRGHSSLHAALDGAIEVERSVNSRCWSASKVKDGEDGKQAPFKLNVIDLGLDADGDPITSCAAGPDTVAIFVPREPSGRGQKAVLKVVRGLLSASQIFGQAGCDLHTRCFKVEDAITSVAATLTAVQQNKRTNEARRLVKALIDGGYLHSAIGTNGEAWLWQ